jgi:sorbitol/mannitol transport system permease protein
MAMKSSASRARFFGILAWTLGILMFFPILWTAIAAFKSESDAYSLPQTLFVTPWTMENFAEVQSRSDYLAYLINTIIIAGLSTLLGLVFAVPAAWSMAFAPRHEHASKLNGITWAGIVLGTIAVAFMILYAQGWVVTNAWLGFGLLLMVCVPPTIWVWTRRTADSLLWILSTKMMPPAGALVPIFLIFNRNGLIFKDWGNGLDLRNQTIFDSHWGMVPLMMLINLPIMIWMLYTYFKEIPGEILEASRMDGAGLWSELTKILTPMAIPGIVSTCLLSLILAWNEAFWTLNLTTKNAAPLSFLISEYTNPQGQFWAKLSAASIMAITPILVIGWFSQRQLVRGLTFGAVK